MKKYISALLALFLLTACAPPAPAPAASPSPDSQFSTLNSPLPPTPSPASLFPDVDALPTLAPFALDEKYMSWYDETPREFLPRDDYGEIYPYIGGCLWVTDYGYRYMLDYRYGFCTADGKILCAPVFTGVYAYTYGGEVYYACRRTAEYYAWETPPTADDLRKTYLIPSDGGAMDAYNDYYDFPQDSPFLNGVTIQDNNGRSAAVREDGTVLLTAEDGNYIEHRGDFLIVHNYSGERQRRQIYDLDGNLVLESDAYLDYLGGGWFVRQTDEKQYELYKDGKSYASFRFADGNYVERLADDRFLLHPQGTNPYIIDSAGVVVFDFDGYGERFRQAYTWETRLFISLTVDGRERTGVLDIDGETLIPPEFDVLRPINGKYTARQGSYGGLVDENGEWLVKVSLLDSVPD